MVSKILSIALSGLEGRLITVEVDLHQGLPAFHIVGLPGQSVQEARIRVAAALKNSGFKLPLQKIVVNLAPADLNKSGTNYDLAIAVGILLASRQIRIKNNSCAFWGELSLTGETRFSRGALPVVAEACKHDLQEIFIPDINAKEAGIIAGINIKPVKNLVQLVNNFSGLPIPDFPRSSISSLNFRSDPGLELDFSAIRGQQQAKRGLIIAAAGSHNILFKGPPGTGKTHLSRAAASILPTLTFDEMLAVTKIYSIAGLLGNRNMITTRPFRAPHHTASQAAVIGGGSSLHPGEITLAHKGVLFLDEFTEFPSALLEALRQPLEDQVINLSRSSGAITFPADFMLIAAMNPCKCGFHEDPGHVCTCTASELEHFGKKISGPILDRIDLKIGMPRITAQELFWESGAEPVNPGIRLQLERVRTLQVQRSLGLFKNELINSRLDRTQLLASGRIRIGARNLLKRAFTDLGLSPRSLLKIMRVSRTIADLELEKDVTEDHVAEALSYRF